SGADGATTPLTAGQIELASMRYSPLRHRPYLALDGVSSNIGHARRVAPGRSIKPPRRVHRIDRVPLGSTIDIPATATVALRLLSAGALAQATLTEEAAQLLQHFGVEPRLFHPADLPLPDAVQADQSRERELHVRSE